MLSPERTIELLNYVQWDLNWDPIGASDLCYDFVQWAHSYDDGISSPAELVKQFQKSKTWELYFG